MWSGNIYCMFANKCWAWHLSAKFKSDFKIQGDPERSIRSNLTSYNRGRIFHKLCFHGKEDWLFVFTKIWLLFAYHNSYLRKIILNMFDISPYCRTLFSPYKTNKSFQSKYYILHLNPIMHGFFWNIDFILVFFSLRAMD